MSCYSIKKIMIFFAFSFLISACTNNVRSQNNFPKIGDRLPSFYLHDLHYYSKTKASSDIFSGKPLIIDFVSEGCDACFLDFARIDSLKKEFEGKVQFLLVGKRSPTMQKQYERYMKHYGLDLPIDYDDSAIWDQFGVWLVPYTVWIDADGIIRQITTSFALKRDRINNLIAGKNQTLTVSVNQSDEYNKTNYGNFFDNDKILLTDGNGGADTSFLYRSILCKWDYRTYFYWDYFINSENKNRIQEVGVSLNMLFNLAFGDTVNCQVPKLLGNDTSLNHYGEWARYPLVESSRSSLFSYDQDSAKNIFSYSLVIPEAGATAKKLQHMMQTDLKNYFSFEVHVETRKMPCWKMIALKNDGELLKTRGGLSKLTGDFSHYKMQNEPIQLLLNEIWGFHQYEPIFIDETGINYNIDLDIDAVMSDMNDIRRALQQNGLDLVLGEKDLKTIVVRDSREF
jgi:hypothetical protein